ncbi:hypothetical protein DFH06DRAFT_1146992 [Mycena polygramma]|nr:hypothetical protein DFH06DRAFT_1146992 [Mycena polygramma]
MASGYLAFAGLILPQPRHKHISATLANPSEYRTVRSLENLVTFHTAGEQRKQPAGGKAQTSDTILEGIERKATHMRESVEIGWAQRRARRHSTEAVREIMSRQCAAMKNNGAATTRGDAAMWCWDAAVLRSDAARRGAEAADAAN